MSDLKCARSLVSLAERDIRNLQLVEDIVLFGDEAVGNFAQQATEKLLKAWIACMGEVFPLTHNLEALLDIIEKRDSDASQFRDLEAFRPFAVEYRYKFLPKDAKPLDREGIASRLNALLERVRAEIAAAEPRVDRQS